MHLNLIWIYFYSWNKFGIFCSSHTYILYRLQWNPVEIQSAWANAVASLASNTSGTSKPLPCISRCYLTCRPLVLCVTLLIFKFDLNARFHVSGFWVKKVQMSSHDDGQGAFFLTHPTDWIQPLGSPLA